MITILISDTGDTSPTPAQLAAREIKALRAHLAREMVRVHQDSFARLWHSHDASPAEILDELGTEASDVFDDASALVGFLLGQHTGRPIVADFAPEFYTPPCTYTHHADGTITLN